MRNWNLEGGFDLIDITNGYFMVNFDMEADRDKAVNG